MFAYGRVIQEVLGPVSWRKVTQGRRVTLSAESNSASVCMGKKLTPCLSQQRSLSFDWLQERLRMLWLSHLDQADPTPPDCNLRSGGPSFRAFPKKKKKRERLIAGYRDYERIFV